MFAYPILISLDFNDFISLLTQALHTMFRRVLKHIDVRPDSSKTFGSALYSQLSFRKFGNSVKRSLSSLILACYSSALNFVARALNVPSITTTVNILC